MTLPPVYNNVTTTLRTAHTPGDGIIRVAAGTGALFGNTFPIRITCQPVNNRRSIVIFYVNSRSTDDLAVSAPIEGTSDIALAVGDICQMRLTAGAITEIENKLLYSTSVPTNPTVGGITAGSTFSNTPLTTLTNQLLHSGTTRSAPSPAAPLPDTTWYPLGNPYILNAMTQNSAYCDWCGGFAAGPNAYLMPAKSGMFLRLKLMNFTTITPLNLQAINSRWLGFGGGFTDGRYGYLLCVADGWVVRVDLQNFTAAGTTGIQINGLDTLNNFAYLYFGVTDGLYGYTPSHYETLLARFSITNFSASTAQMIDLRPLNGNQGYVGGLGVDTDGKNVFGLWGGGDAQIFNLLTATSVSNFSLAGSRILDLSPWSLGFQSIQVVRDYVYLTTFRDLDVGTMYGKVLKVNKNDFTDVTMLDLATINSNYIGFQGTCSGPTGRFLYLSPYNRSWLVRIDLNDFQTVEGIDLSPFGVAGGCNAVFSDGRFAYLLQYFDANNPPYNDAGRIIRFQQYQGGHF